MASIIRIKRSSGILAPATLKTAELAYAYGTGTTGNQGDRLFVGKGDDGTGQATSVVVIGGSYFTDMLDHNPGLLRTNSAIIVDSDKKIEELKSGNIHIDGFNDKITGLVSPTDSSDAATKKYVDSAIGLIPSAVFTFTGDSGSDTVTLTDSGLNFQGQPGEIHARVTDNNLLISLDSSGVVAGTYGSATSIPIIKVDDFGRVDSVGTSPLSTTLSIADSNDSHSIDLINDTLKFRSSDGTLEINNDSSVMNFELPVVFTGSDPSNTGQPNLYGGFTPYNQNIPDSPNMPSIFYGSNDHMPRMQFDKYGRLKKMTLYGNQPHIYWTDTDGSGSIYQTTANPHGGYKPITFVGRDGIKVDLTGDQTAGSGGIRGDGAVKYTIALDSATPLSAASITVDSGTYDLLKTDQLLSRTGQNMTIAPNTDSGGTITIGTRYGYSQAQGNHKLDLTNVGLKAGVIQGETVGTTYLGSWAVPFAGLTNWYDLGFRGGSSHMYILDGQDSALTVTAKDNLGNVGADMMRFNTYDSQIHLHVDQVVDNDKNIVFGSGYTWNNNPVPGRTTMRHDTTDHYFEFLADSHTTEAEFAAKNITLIGYDPAFDFRSGFGASTKIGNINLDGNVLPAVGRGSSLYNIGYRRNLGASGTRFGTVYVDSVDRGHYIDSGIYGNAAAIPVFTVNKTGLIDSIGTVPVAGVDSASWGSASTHYRPGSGVVGDNLLTITTGDGTSHQVEISQWADSVQFGSHVRFSHQPNDKVIVPHNTKLSFQDHSHTGISGSPQAATMFRNSGITGEFDFYNNGNIKIWSSGNKGVYFPGKVEFENAVAFDDSATFTKVSVDNVTIDGNTISSTDNSNQLFIDPFPVGDSGDLVVRGNLIVQGTQTTVNSSVVSLNDKNLVLADSATTSATADGAGLTVGGDQFDSTATKPQFVFDAATYMWDPNLPIDIPFVSLDSAVFLNGVALREVMEDHLDNFFGVDSNNAVTITYDDVANTMTWKGTDATTSQKGVSSFDSSNFTITAGHVAVTVLDGGTW